jgi:tetratricopeptide (TPR) repeat protein
MNVGKIVTVIAAFSIVGVALALSSGLVRKSSTLSSSSISKSNNNSASQSNEGLTILFDSAREYYVKGDYEKANIFFERVLEIYPDHIETLNGKGILLFKLSDYDKARNCFEKVLRVDPKNIVALNNIEILDKKKGEVTTSQNKDSAPAPSKDTSKKMEKPAAPSRDSGTAQQADPRNPYNDPTLPYYNPALDKKNN